MTASVRTESIVIFNARRRSPRRSALYESVKNMGANRKQKAVGGRQ
jgi:hypothetical protein